MAAGGEGGHGELDFAVAADDAPQDAGDEAGGVSRGR